MSIYTLITLIGFLFLMYIIPLRLILKIIIIILVGIGIYLDMKFNYTQIISHYLFPQDNMNTFKPTFSYIILKAYIYAFFEELIKSIALIIPFLIGYYLYIKKNSKLREINNESNTNLSNIYHYYINNKEYIFFAILISSITFFCIENILYIENIYKNNNYSFILNFLYGNELVINNNKTQGLFSMFLLRAILPSILHIIFTFLLFFGIIHFGIYNKFSFQKYKYYILYIYIFFLIIISGIHAIGNILIDYGYIMIYIFFYILLLLSSINIFIEYIYYFFSGNNNIIKIKSK